VGFNDVFDAKLDAKERPERPIPSGRASLVGASLFGATLSAGGIIAALQVSLASALIAVYIAFLAVAYDAVGKHHTIFGPLTMGLCRGGNLLLGLSMTPSHLRDRYFIVVFPILYIAAVTLISRGEVHGGTKSSGILALGLILLVTGGLVALGMYRLESPSWTVAQFQLAQALPFLLLFCWRVIPPFFYAVHSPTPGHIRLAVKTGVLSLIVLNAALATAFAGWESGIVVLALLPCSTALSRLFAMT
jgi:4-hydroxybenzoate polyprenyltransferase